MQTKRDNPTSVAFLAALERNLTRQAFETWFRPLTVTKQASEGKLRVSVPNTVAKEWILSNYAFALEQSLKELSLSADRIEWLVTPSAQQNRSPAVYSTTEPTDSTCNREPDNVPESLSINSSALSSSSLNEKYTFGSFVVASCNRFAHAATQAVADGPGKTYNPLYIYGGVGLGKTHLLQAIGHTIRAVNPKLQVAYLSLERFMNELINAIRYGYDKTQLFREKYRSIDVLLIDDVQFIAGKERTQEEFFHTFNALYDAQKQIVLTSDCPPREIPEIEERLHSRFEWGLIADIEPPDLETKVAILRRKAELQHIDLPDDVALFLAGNSKHNVRELEGSLVRVMAMASLRGVPLSKNLAQDTMRNVAQVREENTVTIPMIQKVVADHYKVTIEDLRARSNMRQVLIPRQIAMYLCKKLTKKSYPEIGRHFGGKHHTTVIHSFEKIDELVASDRATQTVVKRLIDTIGV